MPSDWIHLIRKVIGRILKWEDKKRSNFRPSRMPLMSPGGQLSVLRPILAVVRAATLLLLLTLNLSSGSVTSENVVIEIGNINQPDNCSLFLTNLEVTIRTRIISILSGKDISTFHHNLTGNGKIKYKNPFQSKYWQQRGINSLFMDQSVKSLQKSLMMQNMKFA